MKERHSNIDIAQDIPHQRRLWLMERIGWALIALILAAACAGLLGPGPLSKATAGQKHSGLWVEYNRYDRYEAPSRVRVHLGAAANKERTLRLWVNRKFMERVELKHSIPQPEHSEIGAERVTYVFQVARTNEPLTLGFEFRASTFGAVPVRIGIEGGPHVEFSQFFYP